MRNFELPGRSAVHATGAMAATSHPLATQTAVAILQAGGNAMDAAIAACAVQCVVEPQSTGIGGDCFVLYAPNGGGDVVAYNGSGRAPKAAAAAWYAEHGIRTIDGHSAHAVTVPGAVDAWCRLIADHGTMAIGDVLKPAIRYARDGFPVHARVASDWMSNRAIIDEDAATRRIYLPGGAPPAAGGLHRLPELAKTLERIAKLGRDAFYTGPVAEDIVKHLRSLDGLHTLDDFAEAAGEYVAPIKTRYRGFDVHECPPNGQGITALLLLNIVSGLGLDKLDPLSPERLHLMIEASRLAYAERDAVVADPRFVKVPVDRLLSADFAGGLRGRIVPDRANAGRTPVDMPAHADTVYISVVDKDRNAVSFINSLFEAFGSGITAPDSGVLLQNRGYAFRLDPQHPNCIGPGKRPMHTIIPGMLVKDGRAAMPFGVMGGQYQAFGHAYLLTNMFEHGLDVQEAMDLPRLFPTLDGPVEVESGMPNSTVKGLKALGHKTQPTGKPLGGSQAIRIDWESGVLAGGSDPRKDGCAIGY